MIFIDTGAWIGLEDVNDKNHAEAVKLIHISEEIEEESWLVFEEFNKDKNSSAAVKYQLQYPWYPLKQIT